MGTRILVLGATGRTGKHIVAYALAKGYEVNCLVRNPDKLASRFNLNVIKGDTTSTTDMERAIVGCSAIVSALNISRTSDFPFSPLRTPKELISKTIANTILVAEKNAIKRIVVCSAWGVADTRKDIPFWFRWTIDFTNIKYAYGDHERQEALLEKSNMDWTIVRPVGLTHGMQDQKITESFLNSPKPKLLINRKSVAKYIIDSLDNDNLVYKKVVISNGL